MQETSPNYHKLLLAFATARALLGGLPNHTIPDDDTDLRLRAFVLICHAAIEEYLESLSIYILAECRKYYYFDQKIRSPLFNALGYYKIDYYSNMSTVTGPKSTMQMIQQGVDMAIELHRVEMSGNNGIKSKDQNAITGPLGFKIHDFDPILSQNLNAYGTKRGEIAHAYQIKQKQPKAGHLATVSNIERLLTNFDNEMCSKMYDVIF